MVPNPKATAPALRKKLPWLCSLSETFSFLILLLLVPFMLLPLWWWWMPLRPVSLLAMTTLSLFIAYDTISLGDSSTKLKPTVDGVHCRFLLGPGRFGDLNDSWLLRLLLFSLLISNAKLLTPSPVRLNLLLWLLIPVMKRLRVDVLAMASVSMAIEALLLLR